MVLDDPRHDQTLADHINITPPDRFCFPQYITGQTLFIYNYIAGQTFVSDYIMGQIVSRYIAGQGLSSTDVTRAAVNKQANVTDGQLGQRR